MDSPVKEPPVGVRPTQKRRRSFVGVVVALLGLAALGALAWYLTHQPAAGPAAGPGGPGAGPAGARRGPPASTVGVATVERTDIPVIVEALGTVTAPAVATVRPQVSGVLKEVKFSEGQMVKAGQLLAVIDPRQFEMALMQATGQRQRDEAQLQNAKVVLERYRTLLEQDSIARQDVDTQAALVKQLEGTVATDKAAEGTARLNLGYSKVTAPISGRIGLRNVDIGNVVSPGDANGIVVITQTQPIDVEFAVPQDRIPELVSRVHEGAALPVAALDRSRQNTLDKGAFLAMDNQVDPQTGTVRAKARFNNAQGVLFPSQFVNVQLELNRIRGAVVVPVSAVRHGSNGDFVFVLNVAERTVSMRNIKRGIDVGDKVQIVSGLNPGEQVITEGADRLKDGAKVMLAGDRPAGVRRPGAQGAQGSQGSQGAAGAAGTTDATAPGGQGQQRGHRRRQPEAQQQ